MSSQVYLKSDFMEQFMMELSPVFNTPFVFPGLVVGMVLICAVLVFVFGFKSVEDFPFDKLTTVADDRKPAGKKRKLKDKKSQSNGQATVVADTKKKSESEGSKVVTGKSKQVSPSKDVAKTNTKQEKKPGKVEPSPEKGALKETKSTNKDSNKIPEETHKQGKGKDVGGKQRKDQQTNKQSKNKGKENVEVKNKKNTDKSKNKLEEKPKDNDEGEWEQIFSRKDKKNRKPVASDEETTVEKSVKTEAASPAKKKKTKSPVETAPPTPPAVETVSADPIPTPPAPAPETPEPVKDKPAKKEKEQKKEKKQVEDPPAVENVAANLESEGEGKAAKKKKKKPAAKEGSDAVEEKTAAAVEPEPPKPQAAEFIKTQEAEPETNGAAFDELGDQWKEAKTPKKASKKKVRKAE